MPLARRLSNSSLEPAFNEFCVENPPLSRQPSFRDDASVSSNAKRRHDEKAERGQEVLKKRRSMSNRSLLGNKKRPPKAKKPANKSGENDENIIQSPTPYHTIAKERGFHSPPETRAAKKLKTNSARKLDFGGKYSTSREGVMMFSPPNQAANAEREKKEIERKTQER